MRKLFALYINEMTKLLHRVSMLVVMIVMIVCVIGYSLLSYFSYSFYDTVFTSNSMEEELEYWKSEKSTLEYKLEAARASTSTDAVASISSIQDDIDNTEIEIKVLSLFIENGINRYTSKDFRAKAIEQIYEYSYNLISLRRQAKFSSEAQDEVDKYEGYIQKLENIIKSKDYKSYIEFSKSAIYGDTSLSDTEREINNEYYDLLYLNDPNGTGEIDGLEDALAAIKNERLSLYTGLNRIDYTKFGMPLSIQDEEYITNKLAVDRYNVENGYLSLYDESSRSYDAASAVNKCLSLGTIFIAIVIMIIAGTTVSQEIGTGSIKSLIIAPVKRWKIMTAKLLSVITVIVTDMLLLYIISLGISTVLYGKSIQAPYVYAVQGVVSEIPFMLYELISAGLLAVKVTVYAVFALLLSTLTRNSAVSVGLSIGTYFGLSTISSILTLSFSGEWLKFIPFNHLELQSRVFEFSPIYTSSYSGMLTETSGTTSLLFSAIYIAVLTVTMIITIYDSFNNRDIK